MSDGDRPPPPRRRRRAVGPAGAAPSQEPSVEPSVEPEPDRREDPDDAERLRRDVPPHHDRGV